LKGVGSFAAHCQACWKEVAEHNPEFGSKPFREIFSPEELVTVVAFIRSGSLDLIDYAYQIAILSLGRHLAFRGRQDYRDLEWTMIEYGFYPDGHLLAGEEWIQVGNGLLSKHNQLTLGASIVAVFCCILLCFGAPFLTSLYCISFRKHLC